MKKLEAKIDELKDITIKVLESLNSMREDKEKKMLTIKEAAKLLNLSVPTIYTKVSKKQIPYTKAGKRLYFNKLELESYMEGNSQKLIRS